VYPDAFQSLRFLLKVGGPWMKNEDAPNIL
jgi:hypothetical protein